MPRVMTPQERADALVVPGRDDSVLCVGQVTVYVNSRTRDLAILDLRAVIAHAIAEALTDVHARDAALAAEREACAELAEDVAMAAKNPEMGCENCNRQYIAGYEAGATDVVVAIRRRGER